MTGRQLWIWMDGQRVGTLDGTDRRSPRITYAQEWIEHPGATPLSTSMPLAGRVHAGAGVEAWLWGLLPDNERVLERWASRFQCSASDVVGLLAGVGADVAGAAQFLVPGQHSDGSGDPTHRTVTEAEIADVLRDLRTDATRWHPAVGGRWSLAGAQAKVALACDENTGEWSVPAGSAPTTHILKPAISGMAHHDLNEHLCLRTAGEVGIRAAGSRIQEFEGESALVVRRYDRIVLGGRVVRVHQEDLCQALSVHPVSKYESDGGPGVLDMVEAISRAVTGDARPTVATLLHAVAFNWLTLGTDAHAKNYSLLLSGPQVRLAPCYDLASALTLGEHPRRLRLAQKIGGEYRPTVVAARHWERLGTAAGIGGERLVGEIRSLARDLPDAMSTVIADDRLTRGAAEFSAKLLDALAEWNRQCLAVL